MTVPVKQNFRGAGAQRQVQRGCVFFPQQSGLGDGASLLLLLTAQERRRVFLDHRETTGLAKQNLVAALGDREERFH